MQNQMPDFDRLKAALERKFGGSWVTVLRIHPQLTARHVSAGITGNPTLIDASREDDMCEVLGAADVLVTDYSAMAFDAAYVNLLVFLYVYDLRDYVEERGNLMWDLQDLPFSYGEDMEGLVRCIEGFDEKKYCEKLQSFFKNVDLKEDGSASKRIVDLLEEQLSRDIKNPAEAGLGRWY